jgi:hypothetical protein
LNIGFFLVDFCVSCLAVRWPNRALKPALPLVTAIHKFKRSCRRRSHSGGELLSSAAETENLALCPELFIQVLELRPRTSAMGALPMIIGPSVFLYAVRRRRIWVSTSAIDRAKDLSLIAQASAPTRL